MSDQADWIKLTDIFQLAKWIMLLFNDQMHQIRYFDVLSM